MAIYTVLVFALTVFGFTHCAFVDTLQRCAIKDSECHKNVIHQVLQEVAENGLEEYEIPAADPIKIHDVDVSIPEFLNMTLIDGNARGVKDCVINKYETLFEKSKAIIDLTCDIVIKGKYRMSSDSPVFTNLLGGALHGEGDGKVKIGKINVVIEYYYKLTKKGDEIYFKRDGKKSKYTWDIKDRVTLSASNLYLGDKESSKQVVGILNQNWKALVGTFGKQFVDSAMKLIFRVIERFFSKVPTRYYISDDLSQYL